MSTHRCPSIKFPDGPRMSAVPGALVDLIALTSWFEEEAPEVE